MKRIFLFWGLSGACALYACGGGGTLFNPDAGDDGGVTPEDDSGVSFPPTDGSVVDMGVPEVTPPEPVSIVYAHSPNDLYKLDPKTKKVTLVGAFNGCSGVIDMAIDENSNGYCTASGGVFKLDLNTAKCTLIATGGYPNSLSFVPKGTLDSAKEALVGYFGDQYSRIDTTTGAVTTVGSLGGGYSSSGDLVSVKNGGTFLTVVGSGCGDCLLQVNPKTGAMIQNYGSVNHPAVYGLAFWAGVLYGFDNAGELFSITVKTTITTANISIPSAPPGLQFWGAGSTTSAPVATEDGGTIPIK